MARPLSFEPQEKLNDAMFIFWREGFANTSVNELSSRLSINKFSIYKQFGNKNEFYLKVLTYYNDTIFALLLKPLEERNGLQSIHAYFDNFSTQVSKPNGSYGCLINNTLLADKQIPNESLKLARKMVGSLHRLLKENFEIAERRKEIKQGHQDCLNFTLMNIQALLNTRKTLGPLLMQKNLRFLTHQMRHW